MCLPAVESDPGDHSRSRSGAGRLIITDRERTRLNGENGVLLAEVVSDTVIACKADGSGESTWQEVEVEQGAGGQELADAIESVLLDAGLERSASPSKLKRALARRSHRTPVTRSPRARRRIRGSCCVITSSNNCAHWSPRISHASGRRRSRSRLPGCGTSHPQRSAVVRRPLPQDRRSHHGSAVDRWKVR